MLVQGLSLAGRPLSAEEQILYVLRGLRSEYRQMAGSLTAGGAAVTIPQLADHLQSQDLFTPTSFCLATHRRPQPRRRSTLAVDEAAMAVANPPMAAVRMVAVATAVARAVAEAVLPDVRYADRTVTRP